MILEAFAEYLHEADPRQHSRDVLAEWLLEKLASTKTGSNVEKVLQLEIIICKEDGSPEQEGTWVMALPRTESIRQKLDELLCENDIDVEADYFFRGSSESGNRLLKSLDEYSQSYEHQKWARWVHQIKASDFKNKKEKNP